MDMDFSELLFHIFIKITSFVNGLFKIHIFAALSSFGVCNFGLFRSVKVDTFFS